jgi:Nucleotidyl transferase AbiEii toxin, Type IV TA system
MVKGLDLFKAHFAAYDDCYVLIGGTACSILFDEAEVTFRETKDLDIVLCLEATDAEFVRSFWDFVRAGKYQNKQKSTGKKQFYRFTEPENSSYPVMLELFSRKPDILTIADGSELTPIPFDEDVSSLSAILLNDDYYKFIKSGTEKIAGLPLVTAEYLIPLKALAWLDLSERKAAGSDIDSKKVKKHRNDIFRLYQLLTSSTTVELPESIRADMQRFMNAIAGQPPVDTKAMNIRATADVICDALKKVYSLT